MIISVKRRGLQIALCLAFATSAMVGCSSQTDASPSPSPSVTPTALLSSLGQTCSQLDAATANVGFVQAGTTDAQRLASELSGIAATANTEIKPHIDAMIYAAEHEKDMGRSFDTALGRVAGICGFDE